MGFLTERQQAIKLERQHSLLKHATVPDDVQDMRDHAERFRRLARVVQEEGHRQHLLDLAQELDAGAKGLEEIAHKRTRS